MMKANAEIERALRKVECKARNLLAKIDTMTTKDFSRGKDGKSREALREALAALGRLDTK